MASSLRTTPLAELVIDRCRKLDSNHYRLCTGKKNRNFPGLRSPKYQIYRCWIVYGKSWRVTAILVVLLLYNIASVVAITYWGYLELMSRTSVFHAQIVYVHEGFLISTIVINIYATCEFGLQSKNCSS